MAATTETHRVDEGAEVSANAHFTVFMMRKETTSAELMVPEVLTATTYNQQFWSTTQTS